MKFFSLLVLVMPTALALGSEPMRIYKPNVAVSQSAAQQLQVASDLSARAVRLPDGDERRQAVTDAAETYEMVHRVWPKQKNAVVAAAIGEADLLFAVRLYDDAIRVLSSVVDISHRSDEVQLRLGKCLMKKREWAAAKKHLLLADAAASAANAKFAISLTLADLCSRLGDTACASERFRHLGQDKTLDDTNRTFFLLRSARENVRAGRSADLDADLNAAEERLAEAVKKNVRTSDEMMMQNRFADEIVVLRKKVRP